MGLSVSSCFGNRRYAIRASSWEVSLPYESLFLSFILTRLSTSTSRVDARVPIGKDKHWLILQPLQTGQTLARRPTGSYKIPPSSEKLFFFFILQSRASAIPQQKQQNELLCGQHLSKLTSPGSILDSANFGTSLPVSHFPSSLNSCPKPLRRWSTHMMLYDRTDTLCGKLTHEPIFKTGLWAAPPIQSGFSIIDTSV